MKKKTPTKATTKRNSFREVVFKWEALAIRLRPFKSGPLEWLLLQQASLMRILFDDYPLAECEKA